MIVITISHHIKHGLLQQRVCMPVGVSISGVDGELAIGGANSAVMLGEAVERHTARKRAWSAGKGRPAMTIHRSFCARSVHAETSSIQLVDRKSVV